MPMVGTGEDETMPTYKVPSELPSPFQLAGYAECCSPDTRESAGASFLAHAARDLAERVDYIQGEGNEVDPSEVAWQVADNAPDVYTHPMWSEFVDLAAYQEDPTDLGCDGSDMEQSARVCLYMIAERMCYALLAEWEEG